MSTYLAYNARKPKHARPKGGVATVAFPPLSQSAYSLGNSIGTMPQPFRQTWVDQSSLVRHVRRGNPHRVLRGLALTLTGVLAFAVTGVGVTANHLTGNLAAIDLDRLMTHERPAAATAAEIAAYRANVVVNKVEEPAGDPPLLPMPLPDGANSLLPVPAVETPLLDTTAQPLNVSQPGGVNILVMGTDGRGGENQVLGGGDNSGARSDSTILMHISADHTWITAVSIPRDTIVNIPRCPTSKGKYIGSHPQTRFNAAFAYGADAGNDVASGAICTLATVEQITGIRLDGFVALDFAGFKSMVDALGGVEMNIPTKIHAPLAGDLRLDPGIQTLDGWQALQYARARTGLGLASGSDLTRITRQQQLISAIAHQVLATNLLTDSPQLLRFLDATTSNMTTSKNFASANGLITLASALSAVDPADIQFITAPIYTNPENPNTVLFAPKAKTLWDNLRYDQHPELQ